MNRYRMVTTQDGREHVSSVVLNIHEAADMLDTERLLLERSGWQIAATDDKLIAQKLNMGKRIRRTIEARAFTPLDDHMTKETTP